MYTHIYTYTVLGNTVYEHYVQKQYKTHCTSAFNRLSLDTYMGRLVKDGDPVGGDWGTGV